MADKTVKHINVGVGLETLEEWMGEDIHELPTDTVLVISKPPDGFTQVKTIYLKEIEQELYLIT